jgi:hypothetical protein
MRAQDPVVEHEIDPRARRQGWQLLEEFQRLEEEMTRAVCPARLEREQDAAVVQEPETLLRDRRAQQIAALCAPWSYADLRDHFVVPFMG